METEDERMAKMEFLSEFERTLAGVTDLDTLREMYKLVVNRFNAVHAGFMKQFKYKDKVAWEHNGKEYTGVVEGVCKRTLTIRDDITDSLWTVSPLHLRKVI